MKQELRRGWRTAVYVIVSLSLLIFVAIALFTGGQGTVFTIAAMSLAIIGLCMFGYVAENVSQRWRFRIGRDGIDAGGGEE